ESWLHCTSQVCDGSFASILPCPFSRPLSTTPDITTSDRDPPACRLPAPFLQTTGTAAAAPASWLASVDLGEHDTRAATNDPAYRLKACAARARLRRRHAALTGLHRSGSWPPSV